MKIRVYYFILCNKKSVNMPLEYVVLMMEGVAFKIHCLLSANYNHYSTIRILAYRVTINKVASYCEVFFYVTVSTKYIKKFQHTGTFILLLQQASLHS